MKRSMGVYRRKDRGKTSRYYSIDYVDENGKRRRETTKVTDFQLALMIRAQKIRDVELRRAGLAAPRDLDPLSLLPLYLQDMQRRGIGRATQANVERQIRAMLDGCARLADVTPEHVTRQLAWLAKYAAPTRRRPEGGLSLATLNHYRGALKAYFAWLVRQGHWRRNPVDAVAPAKAIVLDKNARRPLEIDELERLVDVAPLARATVYLVAATTGLRRNELRQIARGDVDLKRRTWRARAAWTKNKRKAVLPLFPWAAEQLEEYLRHYPRADRQGLFDSVPSNRTLANDLRSAGIEPVTADGKVDLHALARYTLARWLATEEVPLTIAQRLMRHRSPELTSNVYTQFYLGDLEKEIRKL